MIPIPEHLEKFSKLKDTNENTITFSLKCKCGNDRFMIMNNYLTKKEKALEKPYYDALTILLKTPYGNTTTIDERGNIHHWKNLSADGKQRQEVIVPERPYFSGITVVKAVCQSCGKEIVIFDSKVNGYDGMTSNNEEHKNYTPNFKQKGKTLYQIEVKIENDMSLEEFQKNTGGKYDFEFYSNAYSWISIYGISENGKKKKLFDFETA